MAKKIPIEELKVGMIFSKPLYTGDNNVLIPSGTAIREIDYNRLIRWGIKELYTDGDIIEIEYEKEDEEEIIKEIAEYITIYDNCLILFEECIEKYNKKEELNKLKLEEIVNMLLELIEKNKNDIIAYMGKDNERYDFFITHSINSTIIALIGGKQLELDKRQMQLLGMAGLLHDFGMLDISKDILNKNDKLNDEEYNLIKSHPIIAFKKLNNTRIINQVVLDAVLQHQEQFDGNGYPRKLKGDKIGLFAKILAIADSFEAQISPRAYRKIKSSYMAMKSVLAEAQNKFDPKVLRAFLTSLSIYPPGTLIQFNDNSIGAVVSINTNAPLRPKIKLLIDESGKKTTDNIIKDLKEQSDLFIVRVLNKEEFNK